MSTHQHVSLEKVTTRSDDKSTEGDREARIERINPEDSVDPAFVKRTTCVACLQLLPGGC